MIRLLGITVLSLAVAALCAVAAQEPAPKKDQPDTLKKKAPAQERKALDLDDDPEPLLKKSDKEKPKKDVKDKKDLKPEKIEKLKPSKKGEAGDDPLEDSAPPENPAEIIKRIKQNLSETDERLEKKDPGEETRNKQDKIVKDLDKLIKQENDNNQNGGGGGGGGASSSGGGGGASSGGASGGGGKSARRNGRGRGQGRSSAKNNGGAQNGGKDKQQANAGGKDKQGKDKQGKDKSADSGKEGKNHKPDRLGKNNDGGGGKKGMNDKNSKNTIADLYKDIWGHLPQTKRMEMDAYSRERFMPRYEEILRQYYRTIAEQNRRKEGE